MKNKEYEAYQELKEMKHLEPLVFAIIYDVQKKSNKETLTEDEFNFIYDESNTLKDIPEYKYVVDDITEYFKEYTENN